jgi:hypothetical protein
MAKLIAKQADSNLTEAEAIRQAKDGDAAAFEYLYKANCRRVYSVMSGCGGSGSSAQSNRGTASIMVSAQSGTLSHTTIVRVTVQ